MNLLDPFNMRKLSFIIIYVLLMGFNSLLNAKNDRPKRISQSIQLINGFLLVELTVNNQTGKFILDTGAPGFILNANRYPTSGAQEHSLVGLGGDIETFTYHNNVFTFGSFDINVPQVFGIPLEHLEAAVKQPIHGLIGLNVFEGFTVRLDYQSLELEIARTDIELSNKESLELSTRQYGHLNTVKIQKGSKKLRMILDTGSKSSLIDKNLVRDWILTTRYLGSIKLIGADQRIQLGQKVQIEGLEIDSGSPLEQTFITSSFDCVDAQLDVKMDGILGQNFLKNYIVVFAKNRKKIKLYRYNKT